MLRAQVLLSMVLLTGCAALRTPTVPMPFEFFPAANGDPRGLVVLLPGRGDEPADFINNGIVAAVQAVDPGLDVIAVDAHLGYYRARTVVERLHQDVLAPRLGRYGKVWLVGVSLGGLGALAYTVEHRDAVAGLVLLAPFLGDDIVEEVAGAGGLVSWTPPDVRDEPDETKKRFTEVWSLLRDYATAPASLPPLWLGHGDDDYLRAGAQLVGAWLADGHYRVRPGGHRWTVWRPLFAELLPAALGASGRDR